MDPKEAPRRLVRAEAVLASRHEGITVVLEETHDPHNISAVLRTCEAFGIQNVHLVVEGEVPPEINAAITIDAHRWLTIHQHDGAGEALAALRGQGYEIFVGHLDAEATPLPRLRRDARAAYVFGNERTGVSNRWLEAADARFVIPTTGFSGSLNLSVAAALTVYDRLLGEEGATLPPGDLAEEKKSPLREIWYAELAHGSKQLAESYRRFLSRPPKPVQHFPSDQHRPSPPWSRRTGRDDSRT